MMTVSEWIQARPFLAKLAGVQGRIDATMDAFQPAPLAPPAWDAYAPEHASGVPLLHSASAAIELAPAAALLRTVAADLAGAPVPPSLALQAGELLAGLEAAPGAALQAITWLARGEGNPPARHAGLLRYLGWSALGRALEPVKDAYQAWPQAAEWRSPHCPTCGAQPALAALVAEGDGRARLLCCGQCRTRWAWKRLGCPHCGNEAQDRLEVLELTGGDGLRLDVCRSCNGYVKTIAREPVQDFLLADWTTIHLDVLARERGLERRGASLYEL
ncbi:formate dehydrogenase accessory protein FdhE [Anaeromyxobacter oryzisoli]|uniref:formate dehydrogenase accessory protein FdhE n=1 Tax=Anaeromyxobacter oryzisoli TaxID=2925408 RepID=UPI001F57CEE1|nr:formate dehydrogenase accessory protein FdhE [Anaeromyxobacter sp. SG63]